MSQGGPLVTADWLIENIGADAVKVIDATWVPGFLSGRKTGREEYDEGHIPGAVFFDIDDISDPASSLPHMMPDADAFANKLGQLGISNSDRIIAYDSNGFFASARAWWMLRLMGHDTVLVLDGGKAAWQRAGGALEKEEPAPTETTFIAKHNASLVKDLSEMHAISDTRSAAILDARAQGRFDGTAPEPRKDLPSGHIPNSYCVPAGSLLNPDSTMKTPEALLEILQPYADGPVVTTCGSGVSAAVISLALAQIGQWDTALYDGSWTEWAASPDNPVERA
ncbi:MAG: 3-mercaptopyruvate sulfurtransferase [Pseudomonadota bacterium]